MKWPPWVWAVGGALLAAPFLLLATGYDALPPLVPLLRGWDGDARVLAAKSPITVFRVPAIGVLTAAAVALMARRRPPDARTAGAVSRFWLVLFLAACLKSACEGVELTSGMVPEAIRAWAGRGAVAAVVLGLAAAAAQLAAAWPIFQERMYWRLSAAERMAIACLGVGYIMLAVVPILAFGRRPG